MVTRLRGSYPLAVAIVLLGLCPVLVLSTGSLALGPVLARDLRTSAIWLQVVNGLSDAAFAGGVVVAAQLAQRFVLRPVFLGYAAAFTVSSVLAAVAPSLPLWLVGRVGQGATTGLMMIAALPPLVTRFGVRRLPWSVAIVNVGLFGAATLGPLVGGVTAGSGHWRALLWVVAGIGALALLAAYVGYPALDPVDPGLPVDARALGLSFAGAVLVFLATAVVAATTLGSWRFWVPFVAGLLALVVLVRSERRDRALMPVAELSTQLPVTGTLVAMAAGAAFVTAIDVLSLYLTEVAHAAPAHAGWLLAMMPVGLVPAAVLFGVMFRTRYLPLLVNLGLAALLAGSLVLLVLPASGSTASVPWAAALLGFGAGATVAPGLFLAGLGVRATLLGRAFALVQLLRLTASYAVAPVVVYLAGEQSSPLSGVRLGGWVTLGLSLAGLAASLVVPALSGARPQAPDLEGWLHRGERGLASPATAGHLRPGVDDEEAHPLLPSRLRHPFDDG